MRMMHTRAARVGHRSERPMSDHVVSRDQCARTVMPMPNRRQVLTRMAGAMCPANAVDHVLGTRALSDANSIAILGGNPIKLLQLDPVS